MYRHIRPSIAVLSEKFWSTKLPNLLMSITSITALKLDQGEMAV
jgi:hypothetical protein